MPEFVFCPMCGARLGRAVVGDEGEVPFCEPCQRAYYRQFHTCVIVAVFDEKNQVILLRQRSVSQTNHVLVAGYVKYGDSPEETVVKEVEEETGQQVDRMRYLQSYFHEKKGLLMIGFVAFVQRRRIRISGEIDEAGWFDLETALSLLRKGSIAEKHLLLAKEHLAAGSGRG